MLPEVGCSKPASIISSVVLPEPEGPSRLTNSPLLDAEIEVFDHAERAVEFGDAVKSNEFGHGKLHR